MIDRDYILNLVKSKDVSIAEFNYDKLSAPPIRYFFDDFDINRLYQIATSLRYSAKPQVKYQEIDKIMRSRGFVKLSAGTNRVVYRHLELDSIACKVAYDDIGLGDNPREFINQNYLKPFCAKTFEVSPNGVIAFAERLNPITNREEFISIAEDVFELISTFIIGEYVMDDIGTHYFMNYGMRKGFGPCLLDYSFLYKLDGNKLYCSKEDKNSETGRCEGVLDYDPGYNNIICPKCGRIYRAHELEEKINKKELITRPNGGKYRMKVTISGGSKGYNVTSTVDTTNVTEVKDQVVWTSNEKTQKKELHVSLKDALKKAEPKIEVKTTNNKPVSEVKKAEAIIENSVNGVHNEVVEEPKKEEPTLLLDNKKVEEPAAPAVPKVAPIKFASEEEKKSPAEVVKCSMYEAAKNISGAELSNNADINYIDGLLSNLKFIVDTMRGLKAWNKEAEKALLSIVLDGKNLDLDSEVKVEEKSATATASICYIKDTNEVVMAKVVSEELNTIKEDVEVAKAEEEEPAEAATEMEVDADEYQEYVENENVESSDEYDEYYIDDNDGKITGIATFTGKIIDISEKLSTMESRNVLVIEDATGELLTVGNNELLIVDRIDGMDTSNIKIVSKVFLDNVMNEINDKAVEPGEDGALPTVNGVPNEG